MIPPPPRSTLFPYTTLFRSALLGRERLAGVLQHVARGHDRGDRGAQIVADGAQDGGLGGVAPPERRELADSQCRHERSEEHTSELQSHVNLVCRLLLEKKKE